MYISSYSTYVNANSSVKTQQNGIQENKDSSNSFETELSSKTIKNVDTSTKLPINYISNYKALNNQQKLQEDFQNVEKDKFLKLETQSSAKSAYRI